MFGCNQNNSDEFIAWLIIAVCIVSLLVVTLGCYIQSRKEQRR